MDSKELGNLGESIACEYLVKKGYKIVDRNYRISWGEIDIIARKRWGLFVKKDKTIHFVEVKSLSHETGGGTLFKPEDAVGYQKQRRLKRAIQGYLREYPISYETEWQFDIVAVYINTGKKTAKVRFLENFVL